MRISHRSSDIVSRGSVFHHTSHAALAQIEPVTSTTAPNAAATSTEASAMSSHFALRVLRYAMELAPATNTAANSMNACATWKYMIFWLKNRLVPSRKPPEPGGTWTARSLMKFTLSGAYVNTSHTEAMKPAPLRMANMGTKIGTTNRFIRSPGTRRSTATV